MRSNTFKRKLRIKKTLDKIVTTMCGLCIIGTLVTLSVAALIWSVQLVLRLVGVM